MRRHKRLIQIAVSVILLTVILYTVDGRTLMDSMRRTDGFLLLMACLVVLFNRLLMPFKWNLLLRAKGLHIGHWSAIKMYFKSTFLGFFLPPTVGADAVRTWYLKREGCPVTHGVSSIVVERLLGFALLCLFGFFGAVLFLTLFATGGTDLTVPMIASGVVLVIIGIGAAFSLHPAFHQLAQRPLEAKAERTIEQQGGETTHETKRLRIYRKLFEVYESFYAYRKHPGTLALFASLTALEILTLVFRTYLVGLAFGVDISFAYYLAFDPIVLFLIRLPISWDGFGINEGAFVYFLALAGVDAATAFSIGLINHLVFLLGVLPGSLFCAMDKGASARQGAANLFSGAGRAPGREAA